MAAWYQPPRPREFMEAARPADERALRCIFNATDRDNRHSCAIMPFPNDRPEFQ